ncbi:ORF18 [Spodoptera eridania nucleopolyhedrovirus]|uniref:ORF18 n=1 Tax=Spodoptera eridania nucleopolyhedrovirus TaxID=2315721 RepID=A0A346TPV6_9ABAC|nr:ORF18 [Spodoptera eridania nucleopolyhedrovirus]AXU41616.1 ORF18 [Spodoptera eridania nucleopolyhedrovirus]
MIAFTLITCAIIASYIETNVTLQDKDSRNDDDENTLTDKDIDNIFAVIMDEISKIEKTESSDVNYTKIIIGLLILITLFTLKTKIYRISTCWRRKKQRNLKNGGGADEIPLENITIQELNYNVISDPHNHHHHHHHHQEQHENK